MYYGEYVFRKDFILLCNVYTVHIQCTIDNVFNSGDMPDKTYLKESTTVKLFIRITQPPENQYLSVFHRSK